MVERLGGLGYDHFESLGVLFIKKFGNVLVWMIPTRKLKLWFPSMQHYFDGIFCPAT